MNKENIRQESCENSDASVECEINQNQCEECCCEHDDSTDDKIVDQLKQNLDVANQKCDEYLAMAQRIQADFENYKRRNKAAVSDAYRDGGLETVEEFLPVLDNLERALQSSKNSESDEGKAISKGIEMVVKQFIDVLKKMEVEEIEALGQPFDPTYHNAVMQVEAENEDQENTIVEVLQKGYKQNDRVVRYSMVKVAN